MLLLVAGSVPVVIWTYLLVGHAGFWRVGKHLPPKGLAGLRKRVAVVIPARDEAETIADTVRSLRNQSLQPELVLVVDDNSSDGTGDLARAAGAETIAGEPLPGGWSGKLWAVSQGVARAETISPDFLMFTDADIRHDRGSVEQLVAIAESGGYDLVSFMVRLRCETLAERLLIPAFVFFFFLLYPPGRVAGAAGGCVLIRPEALGRAGGFSKIQSQVIDDCALARAVAGSGGRIWLGLTKDTESTRSYKTFGEIGRMIARTAFNQLNHSAVLLLGTMIGLFVTYLLPVVLLFTSFWWIGVLGWALMTVAYAPMVRFYRQPAWWALSLPGVAVFYSGATVWSAIQYWRGAGGMWKGRAQDVH